MAEIVYERGFGSRVRWGSIFAGVVVGLATQSLLGLLGLAVGFTALDPMGDTLAGFGLGSGVWMIISALISTFVGAWVASWLSNTAIKGDGVIHGVLTWGLLMVVTLFMLGTGLGRIVSGTFNLASSALTGVGTGVASTVTEEGGIAPLRQTWQQVQPGQMMPGERLTAEQAEQAANTAAQISWWVFAAAILSLVAAGLGGLAGYRNRPTVVA